VRQHFVTSSSYRENEPDSQKEKKVSQKDKTKQRKKTKQIDTERIQNILKERRKTKQTDREREKT